MADRERLIYTNEKGESVEFSTLSLFHVNVSRDVNGLSDVRNKVYTTTVIGQDGDNYSGDRIETRDIDIVGHIKSLDKIEEAEQRRRLNRVLNPHFRGCLKYICGDFERVIDCRVLDSPRLRTKKVLAQFSVRLLCLSPFWREIAETKTDIATWLGRFEFPLNLSPTWEIGERTRSLFATVQNLGDVETGVRIVFSALGELTNPKLLNVNTQEFIKLNINLQAGDVVTVTTGFGQKRATLNRGGEESNIFRSLDVESTFLQLAVGDNIFRYLADTNADNLEVSIYHDNRYLGV